MIQIYFKCFNENSLCTAMFLFCLFCFFSSSCFCLCSVSPSITHRCQRTRGRRGFPREESAARSASRSPPLAARWTCCSPRRRQTWAHTVTSVETDNPSGRLWSTSMSTRVYEMLYPEALGVHRIRGTQNNGGYIFKTPSL